MSGGVERLTSRIRRLTEPKVSPAYDEPKTVAECYQLIEDLNQRVYELELFRNKPIVALVSAVMLAVAAKLAGAV